MPDRLAFRFEMCLRGAVLRVNRILGGFSLAREHVRVWSLMGSERNELIEVRLIDARHFAVIRHLPSAANANPTVARNSYKLEKDIFSVLVKLILE